MTASLVHELADDGLAAVCAGYPSAAESDLTMEVVTRVSVLVVANRRPHGEGPARVAQGEVLDFRHRFASVYHAEPEAFPALAGGEGPHFCDPVEAAKTPRVVGAAHVALEERQMVALDKLPVRPDGPHVVESEA